MANPVNPAKFEAWPLAKFYFAVTIDEVPVTNFQTVDGLESEISVMEYRAGQDAWHKSKRPGMTSFSNITLKKGMFRNDNGLHEWYKVFNDNGRYAKMGEAKKRMNMVIELKDESDATVLRWDVENCFVSKFTPTGMDADADSEVAVEELEVVCERWELTFG